MSGAHHPILAARRPGGRTHPALVAVLLAHGPLGPLAPVLAAALAAHGGPAACRLATAHPTPPQPPQAVRNGRPPVCWIGLPFPSRGIEASRCAVPPPGAPNNDDDKRRPGRHGPQQRPTLAASADLERTLC